jgi:hypothetical protein
MSDKSFKRVAYTGLGVAVILMIAQLYGTIFASCDSKLVGYLSIKELPSRCYTISK